MMKRLVLLRNLVFRAILREFSSVLLISGIATLVVACQKGPKPSEIVTSLTPKLTEHAIGEVSKSEKEDISTAGREIIILTLTYKCFLKADELREKIKDVLTQEGFRQTFNVTAPNSFMIEYLSEDGKITIKATATPASKETENQNSPKDNNPASLDSTGDTKNSHQKTKSYLDVEIIISYTKR